ncbi:response regulator [Planktosalinus lacus]|uniref:Two-component system response regulator n=1 Tax=Planktosalinus lacus TaxID=1526573 RepID=A0A8J2V9T6_9FLAO|nr:response regulator [Planktosalinus lacus]GGD92691.1 two-component system response regulator [Planktosalinus lacus]
MKSVHILLVEDNPGDILLTTEALEERKLVNKISVVRNGKEALDFLFQEHQYKGETPPDLILLDINIPLLSGHEVLQRIKTDERTKEIPVIILTTSSAERDIHLAYKNHANCFITKPVDIDDFMKAIFNIEDFWIQLVRLPSDTPQ